MTEHKTVPRNAAKLVQLEAAGAQALATMARANLAAGQLPPRNILDWYSQYLVEVLIAYEDTLKEEGTTMEPESLDEMGKQLEIVVMELGALIKTMEQTKQLVLVDQIKQMLKARQLHMNVHADATYGGLLPP